MDILTIKILKEVIENLNDNYIVEYDNEVTVVTIEDKIMIDVSNQRIIFQFQLQNEISLICFKLI